METVNLASKFDDTESQKIAQTVCEDYDTDIESRREWEIKRERWYKLWACHREKKNDPWPGASNVCIPMLTEATNQFHSRSYQSIFAAPGMVKTVPMGEADIKRSENVEDYLNWQTQHEMEEYEQEFDSLLQLLPINGTCFKKLFWNGEAERPTSEYIAATDIVLPYRTKKLETARRITHRIWLHYDELQERNEAGRYVNFDKVQMTPSETNDDTVRQAADEVTGDNPSKVEEKPHLILECHRKWKIKGKMTPVILTVDYDTQTLLRATKRIFKEGKKEKVINFFIDYHFIPNPEGFYSFGFGHFLEQLNEMANTAFNQIFDAGRQSNQPFGFYSRRAGIKQNKIKLHPGKMIEVDDASQVFFPSMQRVDQVLFMVIGLIQQFSERLTSTSDYLSGRESKGTKTPTAHGTLAIIEQGLVTFSVMTKRIFRQLRKELKLLMVLNQVHGSRSKEYYVLEGEVAFNEIKKEDFASVRDLYSTGDPSFASKATRRQEAMEIYNILMANPLVVGNPEAGIKPNMQSIHVITSDILDAYEKKNKNKILPPLPDQPEPPELENIKFMQGDYKAPLPGEEHAKHLAVHLAFIETEFYNQMPKEYKDLHTQHIDETRQLAYVESQQIQGVGGAGLN